MASFQFLSFIAFTVFSAASAFVISPSLTNKAAAADIVNRTTTLVRENGCDPNLCFALDGGWSMSDIEYTLQKDFVQLVSAIVSADHGGAYSAVQYGFGLERITKAATSDINKFLLRVENSKQMKSPRTFIGPGISYCIHVLDRSRYSEKPKKIVLLGDGVRNLEARREPIDPVSIVAKWKEDNPENKLVIIVVNFADIAWWEKIAGKGNVLQVSEWLDMLDLVEELVHDMCGWDKIKF